MGEFRALGLPRRPGRVENHRGVLGRSRVDLLLRQALGHGLQGIGSAPPTGDQAANSRSCGALPGGLFEERVCNEESRTGVLEEVGDLGRCGQDIDRHHDGPGVENAEVGHREFGHVGNQQGHGIPGLHAALAQTGRNALGAPVEFCVAESPLTKDNRRGFRSIRRTRTNNGSEIETHPLSPPPGAPTSRCDAPISVKPVIVERKMRHAIGHDGHGHDRRGENQEQDHRTPQGPSPVRPKSGRSRPVNSFAFSHLPSNLPVSSIVEESQDSLRTIEWNASWRPLARASADWLSMESPPCWCWPCSSRSRKGSSEFSPPASRFPRDLRRKLPVSNRGYPGFTWRKTSPNPASGA